MIPKVIHYCWFGGNPYPDLVLNCIASWKKFCPDYEIKEWNESNFNIHENSYIQEAYEAHKWAFVTDYVRLKVLYEYGGIYMDTDVEVCGSLDMFLTHVAFSGFETADKITTGIMASHARHPFFKAFMEYYDDRHFCLGNGQYDLKTNVETITEIALKRGLRLNNELQTVGGMTFYPNDFFCPKDYKTGIIRKTDRTVCIHHFDGSWHTEQERKMRRAAQFCNQHFGICARFFFRVYWYILQPANLYRKIRDLAKER